MLLKETSRKGTTQTMATTEKRMQRTSSPRTARMEDNVKVEKPQTMTAARSLTVKLPVRIDRLRRSSSENYRRRLSVTMRSRFVCRQM